MSTGKRKTNQSRESNECIATRILAMQAVSFGLAASIAELSMVQTIEKFGPFEERISDIRNQLKDFKIKVDAIINLMRDTQNEMENNIT